MWVKHADDVDKKAVTDYGSTKTDIQWLIDKKEGLHYAMRRFTMKPGGNIGLHHHPEEHEIYVLQGEAEVFSDKEKKIVKAGDVIFVPPNEPHGYKNIGAEDFVFLCIIPILEKLGS